MRRQIEENEQKLEEIKRMVETMKREEQEFLAHLYRKVAKSHWDVTQQKRLIEMRQLAQQEVEKKKHQLRQMAEKQIRNQEAINKGLVDSLEGTNDQLVKDSNEQMTEFIKKQKEEMKKWMEGKIDYGLSGSELRAIVMEERKKLDARFQLPERTSVSGSNSGSNNNLASTRLLN